MFERLFILHPDSSALPSIVSMAGDQVVLPCSWKTHLGELAAPDCHIVWSTLADAVFEQRGEDRWEADEFRGRLEVPEERLRSGNCSLTIRDVQIADTGRYQSFMVVNDARSKKTRVSLQSVKLSVYGQSAVRILSRPCGLFCVLLMWIFVSQTTSPFSPIVQERTLFCSFTPDIP